MTYAEGAAAVAAAGGNKAPTGGVFWEIIDETITKLMMIGYIGISPLHVHGLSEARQRRKRRRVAIRPPSEAFSGNFRNMFCIDLIRTVCGQMQQ